jgi:hypothetical protein
MPVRVTKGIPIRPAGRPVRLNAATVSSAAPNLDVKFVAQSQDEWCWAACCQMVAKFYSVDTKQCELANYLHGQTDCCDHPGADRCNQPSPFEGVGKVYDHLGITCTSEKAWLSPAVILRELTAGRPVEVGYLWFQGGGHVALITGIDFDNEVYIMLDPWFGPGTATYLYLRTAYGMGRWAYSYGEFAKEP